MDATISIGYSRVSLAADRSMQSSKMRLCRLLRRERGNLESEHFQQLLSCFAQSLQDSHSVLLYQSWKTLRGESSYHSLYKSWPRLSVSLQQLSALFRPPIHHVKSYTALLMGYATLQNILRRYRTTLKTSILY